MSSIHPSYTFDADANLQTLANFRSLLRLSVYLASVETVRGLMLTAETVVPDKCLPVESVRMILFPAETRQEAQSRGSLAGSRFSRTVASAESKRIRE